ncbi:hypothetical protein FQZ97_1111620 [compost metagenome]
MQQRGAETQGRIGVVHRLAQPAALAGEAPGQWLHLRQDGGFVLGFAQNPAQIGDEILEGVFGCGHGVFLLSGCCVGACRGTGKTAGLVRCPATWALVALAP